MTGEILILLTYINIENVDKVTDYRNKLYEITFTKIYISTKPQ